ncbi:hypothetical protein SLA2020_161110 [Shorea laevis]
MDTKKQFRISTALRRRRKNPELVLPSHVLESIFQRLPLQDLVRIKAVSSTWKSFAEAVLLSKSCLQRVPWLMFPPPKEAEFDDDDEEEDEEECYVNAPSCCLMNVEENIVYYLKKTTSDLFFKFKCIGSSHGWLIFFDDTTKSPFLLNPLTEHRIQLPLLEPHLKSVLKERSILIPVKAILTAEPDGEYGIVVICDSRVGLGFYKNGDSSWTIIEGSSKNYDDIICCKNQLYAIRYSLNGVVETWDLQGCRPKKKFTIAANYPDIYEDEAGDCTLSSYLVESRGEILLVVRVIEEEEFLFNPAHRTKLFHAYKLDIKREKWVELKSLGDRSLFLGINHSASISTKDLQTCKPNSIYFTDDFWFQILHSPCGHDMGIYCLEDGCFLPVQDHFELPEEIRPLLCWIVPNNRHQIQNT